MIEYLITVILHSYNKTKARYIAIKILYNEPFICLFTGTYTVPGGLHAYCCDS